MISFAICSMRWGNGAASDPNLLCGRSKNNRNFHLQVWFLSWPGAAFLSIPRSANHNMNSTLEGVMFIQTVHTRLSIFTSWLISMNSLCINVLTAKSLLEHHRTFSVSPLTRWYWINRLFNWPTLLILPRCQLSVFSLKPIYKCFPPVSYTHLTLPTKRIV